MQSRARVAPLDHPEREMECLLQEVSMAGLKLVGGNGLAAAAGTQIGIDLPGLLILAEVRYCYQRGERFVVGAKRLGSVLKSNLVDAQSGGWVGALRNLTSHLRRPAIVAPRRPVTHIVSPLFSHLRNLHDAARGPVGFGKVRSAIAKPVIRTLPLREA